MGDQIYPKSIFWGSFFVLMKKIKTWNLHFPGDNFDFDTKKFKKFKKIYFQIYFIEKNFQKLKKNLFEIFILWVGIVGIWDYAVLDTVDHEWSFRKGFRSCYLR